MSLIGFCLDRVLQRLSAKYRSLNAVDVVRRRAALNQLLEFLGHTSHRCCQKSTGGAADGYDVFSQGDRIYQTLARYQVFFESFDMLVFGGRLQSGIVPDSLDGKSDGIEVACGGDF